MPLPLHLLSDEGVMLYHSLSPLRRRVAGQMILAAAHMTGAMNIEEMEQANAEIDSELARIVTHMITRSVM